MQIVYLDQNAASLLAKANPEPIWREIKEALGDGFCKRKLICPLPFEGIIESAPKNLEFRQAIQSLFWQLSAGVAFKPFTVMSNELTLALIRPRSDWTPWIIWKADWAEREDASKKVTAERVLANKCMTNQMKEFVRLSAEEQLTERGLIHSIAEKRSLWICDDLDFLISGQTTEHSFYCPSLIQFLISQNLNLGELEALKRSVLNRDWAKIAIHTFEILLGAKWEYDSIQAIAAKHGAAKYEPNDEIDRMRGAIALTHADLFITEGDLASLCQKAKIKKYCPTLVLSVKNPEKVLEAVQAMIGN